MTNATSSCKIVETLCKKKVFPSKNALLKANGKLKYISDPPLPLSMLLLVTLNVITKSITTLIRGEGGKCVLTMGMSEMTGNKASQQFCYCL